MEIELPDGTILDAPDNADVKTVVRNYQRGQANANTRSAAHQVYDDMGTGERLAVGFARPFVELGLGAKDLLGGLSDEDRSNLERLKEVHGGAGSVGRIAGEVAAFAVPGGAVGRAASRGATLLPRALARFAPAAADMATAAGVEGLKAPGEGESRLSNAVEGALGAGVGRVAGAALKPLVAGVEAGTAAARRMAARGVPLTPGMAKGGLVQRVEDTLEGFPAVGRAIKTQKREALEAWNKNVLSDAVPDGEVTAAGHEGFTQAKALFDDAYDKVWNRPVKTDGLIDSWAALAESAPSAVSRKLGSIFSQRIRPATVEGVTDGRALSAVDDLLRKEATLAARRGATDEAALFSEARTKMRAMMPEGMSAELARVDAAFRQFVPVRRAGSYVSSGGKGEPFTPSQLRQASNAADRSAGKNATARGEAVMQREANDAAQVFGDSARALPMNPFERVALGLGGLPAGVAARIFYPSTRTKATAAEIAALLRSGNITPGALGAAVSEE